MNDIEKITLDDGTTLLIYKVRGWWWWTHRNPNIESIRDGHLATSKNGFPSQQAAEGDFFMHNDYDRDQKAPWPLIVGIVACIIVALALIGYANRAKAHDIYADWKMGKQDCCHDVHCFATPVVQHQDGTWWALNHDGSWLPVLPEQIDTTFPNQGVSHACIQQHRVDDEGGETEARVLCAAVGTGA